MVGLLFASQLENALAPFPLSLEGLMCALARLHYYTMFVVTDVSQETVCFVLEKVPECGFLRH